jgi:S-adenosylmethionine:diacylglycerol 3-amino-3-carboxypropyl transferase
LPLYLQASGQAALLRLGISQRLHLETGNLLTAAPGLAAQVGGFDLISLSNIADWMDDAQFDAVVRDLKACLTAGGALLARTATGSSMIIDVIRRHLAVDDAFLSALPAIERGPWFRILAAGLRRQ